MLDVPALQHAACGDVLMMVKHLRLAEVHRMSSLEHMLCQSGSLNVPIHQCMAVFTDTLLEAPPSLANVHTRTYNHVHCVTVAYVQVATHLLFIYTLHTHVLHVPLKLCMILVVMYSKDVLN